MYIPHPARQGDNASIFDWLRYHVGIWMMNCGADLEQRALYPNSKRCKECGGFHSADYDCDGIPF